MRRKAVSISRAIAPTEGSYFLFGPRGTGKSPGLRAACPDAFWVDLLEPELLQRDSARPSSLAEELEGDKRVRTVVIDEVQRAPELLSVVHALRERRKSLRFVLTGSSARRLKRTGVDLFGGRASVATLHPFMACELGSRFELGAALRTVVGARVGRRGLPSNPARLPGAVPRGRTAAGGAGAQPRRLRALSRGPELLTHASALNISNVARKFQSDLPAAQVSLVHRGERRLKVNGVDCAPCDEFLAELNPTRSAPFG